MVQMREQAPEQERERAREKTIVPILMLVFDCLGIDVRMRAGIYVCICPCMLHCFHGVSLAAFPSLQYVLVGEAWSLMCENR